MNSQILVGNEIIDIGADGTSPTFTINCWRKECAIELAPNLYNLVPYAISNSVVAENATHKLEFKTAPVKSPFNEFGGFDLIITFKSRPASNQIVFSYNPKNVSAYLQRPLTEDYVLDDEIVSLTETDGYSKSGLVVVHRPLHVVNSIAFYHNSKSGNDYKTGKIGSLYSMPFCKWSISGPNIILTIDQKFLNTATYPLTLMPSGDTFGYTTIGGTKNSSSYTRMTKFTSPANLGTITSMSSYGYADSGTQNLQFGIYSDVAGVPTALLAGGAGTYIPVTTTAGWWPCNISLVGAPSTVYWLCRVQASSTVIYYYYDNGATNQRSRQTGWPNPAVPVDYAALVDSIYATFTPSGGSFYQNVGSGSLSSASTLNRKIYKSPGAGAVGLASTVSKIYRQFASVGAGSVSMAGAVASIFKQFKSVGSGSLTIAGTVNRLIKKSIGSGAVSIASTVNRLTAKSIGNGAISIASTLNRLTKTTIGSGAMSIGGTVNRLIKINTGSGAVSLASTLGRLINRAVGSGTLTISSTLGRLISMVTGSGSVGIASTLGLLIARGVGGGAVSLAGALSSFIVGITRYFQDVGNGAVGLASTLGRIIKLSIGNGAVSIAGTVNLLIKKTIGSGAVSLAGALAGILKQFKNVGSGSLTIAGALGRMTAKAIGGGALSISGTVNRLIAKTIGSGSVTLSGALAGILKKFKSVGSGSLTITGAVNRLVKVTIGSGAITIASTLGRLIKISVGNGAVSISGALSFCFNRILKIISSLSTLFGITSSTDKGLEIESVLNTEYTIASSIDTEYQITSLLSSGLTITSEFAEK